MISNELKEIVNQLNAQGKMNFLESATEKQITKFEEENEVRLPSKYKEWLLFSDGGEIFLPAGLQMYGVVHKPVIDVEDNDRPDDSYIVIGALASGDPIMCKKDSQQIAIYNREAGMVEEDEIYEDFIAFLKDLYELLGIGE